MSASSKVSPEHATSTVLGQLVHVRTGWSSWFLSHMGQSFLLFGKSRFLLSMGAIVENSSDNAGDSNRLTSLAMLCRGVIQ